MEAKAENKEEKKVNGEKNIPNALLSVRKVIFNGRYCLVNRIIICT